MKKIHKELISNIYCISNKIILISSWDGTIIKTEYIKKNNYLE